MTSLLSSYNPSVLAIPAYYILSTIPHGLALRVATQGKIGTWDNRNPRSSTMKAGLKQKLTAAAFAKYERMEACHANGMENMPLFASAVMLGNLAGLTQDEMTKFVASFLAVRIAYTAVYVANTTQGPAALRSLLWAAGVSLCFRTILKAAAAMSASLALK